MPLLARQGTQRRRRFEDGQFARSLLGEGELLPGGAEEDVRFGPRGPRTEDGSPVSLEKFRELLEIDPVLQRQMEFSRRREISQEEVRRRMAQDPFEMSRERLRGQPGRRQSLLATPTLATLLGSR